MRGAGVLTPRRIGLTTGYVGTRYRSIVEPIPLKPKATVVGWVRTDARKLHMLAYKDLTRGARH